MIPILYESDELEFRSNGIGRLYDCISAIVTEERNGIYECEFEYPVTGIHYKDIQLGRIIAVEHDTSGDVQPFDIYACTRPIDGVVTFYAYHVSYRLRGVICRAPVSTKTLLSAFNEFRREGLNTGYGYFRYMTDLDLNEQRRIGVFDNIPRSVREILGGVEGSILDTYGGEYLFNKFEVTLFRQRGISRDVTIRYGVNLTEYNEELDFSDTYSWVWAYYKSDKASIDVTIESGYTGLGNRNVGAAIDFTDKFESVPSSEELIKEGRAFLSANQPWLPRHNITVSFINLGESTDYDRYKELVKCNICDTISVVFPRYDMEGKFKIVKVVWDVLQERYREMELGNLSISLSDALGISTSGSSSGSAAHTIEVGHITGESVGSGSYKDYSVAFSTPFSTAPTVIPTFQSTSTAGTFGRCTLGVVSVTATGCTIRVFNGDSSGRAPNIDWIAIS